MENDTVKTTLQFSRRKILTFMGTTGTLGLLGLGDKNRIDFFSGNDSQPPAAVKMKTIGILGGFGPQATMDFEKRLHEAAQRMIEPSMNESYPTMIVFYHRHPPVVLNADNTPVIPFKADPRLLASAKRIGSMADFLLIPSNGVHLMQDEIEQAAGKKVLSMIDVTMEEVKKRQWKKIGVLGFKSPLVYTKPLEKSGIPCEVIDSDTQLKLDNVIIKVMEGREDVTDHLFVVDLIRQLKDRDVDGIIPGCTEIPLLLNDKMNVDYLVNPAELLATAAIKHAVS